MNSLIERYIYDVTRRLPDASRADVKKELEANISDMLPENYTEEDVRKVLTTLGEPRILANGYRTKQRYLISPEKMDDYLRILKIVLIVFGSISFVFGMIDAILHLEATTVIGIFAEVFGKTISEVIQSLFRGFAIVTLIFAGIDAYQLSEKKSSWSLEKLPVFPKEGQSKISRTGSFVGLVVTSVFGVIFIYFLFNHAQYLGWYENITQWTMITPMFNDGPIQTFIPIFIVSLTLSIFVQILKVKYGVWNLQVGLAYTLSQIVSVGTFIIFINYPNLINPAIFTQAATVFGGNATEFSQVFDQATTGFGVFIGIVVTIDIIVLWAKKMNIQFNLINKH